MEVSQYDDDELVEGELKLITALSSPITDWINDDGDLASKLVEEGGNASSLLLTTGDDDIP